MLTEPVTNFKFLECLNHKCFVFLSFLCIPSERVDEVVCVYLRVLHGVMLRGAPYQRYEATYAYDKFNDYVCM